jgi:hypothetical protein
MIQTRETRRRDGNAGRALEASCSAADDFKNNPSQPLRQAKFRAAPSRGSEPDAGAVLLAQIIEQVWRAVATIAREVRP